MEQPVESATALRQLPAFRKKEVGDEPMGLPSGGNPMAMAAGEGPPMPINTAPDAAARFAQMPMAQEAIRPIVGPNGQIPKPGGPGQGISAPIKPTRREFFGLADIDYKSTLVVFALLLIFSNSIFYDFVKKYIPLVSGEGGRTTFLGSLLGAILGSVIYLVIKITAKI